MFIWSGCIILAILSTFRFVQPSAFMLADDSLNADLSCDSIHRLNLEHWSSSDHEMDNDEEEEIEFALIAATENLLQFRLDISSRKFWGLNVYMKSEKISKKKLYYNDCQTFQLNYTTQKLNQNSFEISRLKSFDCPLKRFI